MVIFFPLLGYRINLTQANAITGNRKGFSISYVTK